MKKRIAWLIAIFVLVTGMFIAAKKVRAPESVEIQTGETFVMETEAFRRGW